MLTEMKSLPAVPRGPLVIITHNMQTILLGASLPHGNMQFITSFCSMLKRSCHTAWDYSDVDSGVSAVISLLCISFHLLYPFVPWSTSGSLLLGESERSSCYRHHFLQLLPLGSFCSLASPNMHTQYHAYELVSLSFMSSSRAEKHMFKIVII